MRRLCSALGVVFASALLLAGFSVVRSVVREVSFRYAIGRYSREFRRGMKRKEVEDRLFLDRTRFRQGYLMDIIDLGQISGFPACAPAEVFVALDFDMKDPLAPTEADVLRSVRLVRQEEGCM